MTTEQRSPRGRLPEDVTYRDNGCEVSPSCLECPLARCRYDEPDGLRAIQNRARDAAIKAAWRDEKLTPDDLAERFEVSRRTVFRVLQGVARGDEEPMPRPVVRPNEQETEEADPMTNDDPDQLDYSEFLSLRSQRGGGKYAQELLALKTGGRLQQLVPVKLAIKFEGNNPSTTKNSVRKAADKIGIKNLDVVILGDAIWVCILSDSDVRA